IQKIACIENPLTKDSYLMNPMTLNKDHLRAVVESVPDHADPDVYEDRVLTTFNAAKWALRRSKREERPELAVLAFLEIIQRPSPRLDLIIKGGLKRPHGDAGCRSVGRYLGAVVLVGGTVTADGEVKLPANLPRGARAKGPRVRRPRDRR
ncbi:MAG: hypothetical protein ACRDKI_01090, partial [Solirubrobacterales bacterium]